MSITSFDQLFHEQLKEGVNEKVKLDGAVGSITYLPYMKIIMNESTTKVRKYFMLELKIIME